ncbi:hypothetical protein [Candidatus Cyrtobacter comes]|uniref:hypothetical protein n=1 Tax=Candidatus Cyrtobacter comes TaxID=675776 RepID=UPI002ACDAFD1|nr:hypothetical protein [Candidatus Cyrtobacter comes]
MSKSFEPPASDQAMGQQNQLNELCNQILEKIIKMLRAVKTYSENKAPDRWSGGRS